tara:strand:+ start:44884 stop:45012 length:129 start_codon:yes stop_codon:yes gene_type:complete
MILVFIGPNFSRYKIGLFMMKSKVNVRKLTNSKLPLLWMREN